MESAEEAGAEKLICRAPPRTDRVALSSAMPVPAETVPVATVPMGPVPFPNKTCPPASVVAPVPPLSTVRVPVIVESVVVAVHVGTPFKSAKTCPPVPAVVVARAEEPLP